MTGEVAAPASRARVAAAMFAVYVVWGSTYLATLVAIQDIPPLYMTGLRNGCAGVILFAILKARGAPWPTARQWRGAVIVGALMLAGGSGNVALAERSVSSSFAAMAVASMPLWAAAIGQFYGLRATRREVVGLIVGFCGVVVLNIGEPLSGDPVAFAAIAISPILWAWGSLLSGRVGLARGPMGTATLMLAGSAVLGVGGLIHGERFFGVPGAESLGALAYLVVAGSLVAFSAYNFLLRTVRPAVATSYAYANPVVAIGLGVAFAHESIGLRGILATLLTLVGVAAITRAPR